MGLGVCSGRSKGHHLHCHGCHEIVTKNVQTETTSGMEQMIVNGLYSVLCVQGERLLYLVVSPVSVFRQPRPPFLSLIHGACL